MRISKKVAHYCRVLSKPSVVGKAPRSAYESDGDEMVELSAVSTEEQYLVERSTTERFGASIAPTTPTLSGKFSNKNG